MRPHVHVLKRFISAISFVLERNRVPELAGHQHWQDGRPVPDSARPFADHVPQPSQRGRLPGPQQRHRHHVDPERQGPGREDAGAPAAGHFHRH